MPAGTGDGELLVACADRFAADRRKGNALGTAGWVLLRFTWADLTGAPELVVRRVREVLAAAA
ncbi:hypothetical protein [Pseudonocardia sp. ICBG1034]|uniref:hypothetical protein n=1 Tax=Pseudonocardia sp. ICBG1034 TaxID=2844381 RepID=UPI001CCE247F|nr:hypothetical protein [Pseudonocardia sp. ICBG1034]